MRRAALAVMLLFTLLVGVPRALAAEKWWDAYNRGVTAVNGKSYAAADAALQKAIAENPTEGTSVRAGKSIITYVPHFWLGIAKFNLGETDAALREWHISEEQGAVARTAYYSKMKDWVARAQSEKQRQAQSAASGAKQEAEAAISRAVDLQGTAMNEGGDRTGPYRDAQRKLQEALVQFRKAGTDSAVYRAAAQTAQQASTLFSAAAEEGKRIKAASAVKPRPTPPAPRPAAPVVVVPMEPPPSTGPKTLPQEPAPTPAVVVSPAKAAAEVAVQDYRRRITDGQRNARNGPKALRDLLRRETPRGEKLRDELRGAKSDADYERIRAAAETGVAEMTAKIVELSAAEAPPASTATVAVAGRVDVTSAYRAFATGDLSSAERLLTRILSTTPAAEAYLLRGCVRYTQAMLTRGGNAQLVAATDDFKAALDRNRSLRLDPAVFSPKLVASFEQIRRGR
jgi:tetratricopeptide (TPR) repeat protein